MTTTRTLVVWCRDWSVTTAGNPADDPVAVLVGSRVVACSEAARQSGVSVGQRQREAQNRCPDLVLVRHDAASAMRMFEPVVQAVETLTPLVEILEPGLCAFATRGPSRYFGGDDALAQHVLETVTPVLAAIGGTCRIGIADGIFAARIAATLSTVVPPGQSGDFLAPFPITSLERPELASLLTRLGLKTLGAFAALPRTDVLARFGPDGALAHELARGQDPDRLSPRDVPECISVRTELDPPADRVDVAAFATRSLAATLLERLSSSGRRLSILSIEAETEHAEHLARRWRFDDTCTEAAVADRLRWQLDSWLSGTTAEQRPTSGIAVVALHAIEVISSNGTSIQLWGGQTDADERALRGIARIQALLGPDAVLHAHVVNGRHPGERVRLIPWGEALPAAPISGPWPNQLPSPLPALVFATPEPVRLLDKDGDEISVDRHGRLSGAPTLLSLSATQCNVIVWAGPWTSDDQWWERRLRRRRAFLQVVTENNAAHLLAREAQNWWLEATYD